MFKDTKQEEQSTFDIAIAEIVVGARRLRAEYDDSKLYNNLVSPHQFCLQLAYQVWSELRRPIVTEIPLARYAGMSGGILQERDWLSDNSGAAKTEQAHQVFRVLRNNKITPDQLDVLASVYRRGYESA